MKSVVFFNNKGGVGKTTLLCNVAGYLAKYHNLKICVVDCDPQCNATQYFFDEETIAEIYDERKHFTVESILQPLVEGEGYTKSVTPMRSVAFGVDVIAGDPRLALTEDLLSRDWGDVKASEIRGIKTTLVFSDMLSRLTDYDLVFFDVGPSLGAINRSILLSSDYFVSPMSIDIFSLRAFENISEWIKNWRAQWARGIENVKDKTKIPNLHANGARFIGYVSQQYFQKRDRQGKPRPVSAFERIRIRIDGVIDANIADGDHPPKPYQIGSVPNLFSLVPLSQSSNKPVFELLGSDGVVGAHFQKVKDARAVFKEVSDEIIARISND